MNTTKKKSLWRLPLYGLLLLAVPLIAAGLVITQPVVVTPSGAALPLVSVRDLEQHARKLAEEFHPRSHKNPENLERSAAYIEERFKASGGRVSRQYYTVRGREYCNVLADYGPEQGAAVVIGAHYDADGGEESGSAQVTPGADDNASGVAVLLALAEAFGAHTPPGPVHLVAYCLEEPPFFETPEMGSYFHARSLSEAGVRPAGVIVLDMVGYFSSAEGSQTYPVPGMELLYPDRGDFIAVVGRLQDISLTRAVKSAMANASSLPVYSANVPVYVTGVDFSDHRNYWPFGYSAVMITDLAFYRNTRYHTQEDTPDTLDYQRMAQVTQGIYAAALALLQAP